MAEEFFRKYPTRAATRDRPDSELAADRAAIDQIIEANAGQAIATRLQVLSGWIGFTQMERIRGRERGEPTQTTHTGNQIRVPSRGEFDDLVRKVAPPAGRKRPGETDEPRERSD